MAVALFTLIGVFWTTPVKLASADESPCIVHYYTVNAVVGTDRTIAFEEEISFTMNKSYNSFYRSLPLEGDRYFHIKAESPNNPDFSFDVKENPEVDGFMDINCYGGISAGDTLVYKFSYLMEVAEQTPDGMIIDFVGAGWPFALSNVTVNITFPAPVLEYVVYSDVYGGSGNKFAVVSQSADKTQMTLTAESLPLQYNDVYYETMAAGITVDFVLSEGAFSSYFSTRFAKTTIFVPIVAGVILLAVAVFLLKAAGAKPILTPIVNFRPPKDMDPMVMGKLIDASVDNEDVTSMIYYFASKGYLAIRLDGEEPVLIKRVYSLPSDCLPHQTSLFYGLFKTGDEVPVSSLKNSYYTAVDAAKMQVTSQDIPRYQKKSVLFACLTALVSAAVFVLIPFLIGAIFVGNGYEYFMGVIMLAPVGLLLLFGYLKENRKHRGKGGGKGFFVCSIIVTVIGALIYYLGIGNHLLTETEKILTLVLGFSIAWLAPKAFTNTESFNETLGEILGFKEFITVTEGDKIKFMLQENPELFYDILPYAQVLGVTNEWENKFADITLQPPSWYYGSGYSVFDYYLMNRCMRRASYALLSRPQESSGSRVGRSGGGGGFGGFSGGGRGGGGGGFR